MEWWKRGRWILLYGTIYMCAFYWIEHRTTEVTRIWMPLDDRIPFCEYFIVPYWLWFLFVAVTLIYFVFLNESRQEYWNLALHLGIGMTLFILISWLFPNGQDLRPVLSGENVFERAVLRLYEADTPTNIFPSIHVFNSVACCVAWIKNEICQRHKGLAGGIVAVTMLIVLSTVFLKQHSLWDVIGALVLNGMSYYLIYECLSREIPSREIPSRRMSSQHMKK